MKHKWARGAVSNGFARTHLYRRVVDLLHIGEVFVGLMPCVIIMPHILLFQPWSMSRAALQDQE